MKNVTYKEIAEDLGKTEGTIKNWSKSHPTLLKYVKIGAFCEHNNLDIDRIKKLIEIQEAIKEIDTNH
ncbi:sigma-70 region 4 domain-containing protein [Aliarcobacter cryaerophilus]|uniref:hypothetical protein n=1 Tax=Aliarcobacter cryaerophilus TaxID=28198 RepID=UPI003DA6338C